MLKEDNSGFVNFPIVDKYINRLNIGKTFIYLVAFDTGDLNNSAYELSNLNLSMPGTFVSDDIIQRSKLNDTNISIDNLLDNQVKNNNYDNIYFPNTDNLGRSISIPMTSCICLGWSEFTFELREESEFWHATFRDLTNEGKRLYYSIKKLHNNKEVRILTFNNI